MSLPQWGPESREIHGCREQNRVYQVGCGGRERGYYNESKVSVWDDEQILEINSEGYITGRLHIVPLNYT